MRRSKIQVGLAIVVTLLASTLLALGVDAQERLTLEEVLAPAFPSSLVAASAADRVVWISNQAGVRNLWTASSDRSDPIRLTSYSHDDGRPLGGLQVTGDGSLAVFVRGGGLNAAGEHPNPDSDADGAERTLWVVATAGGEAWSLGSGSSPVISPDGSSVVFRRQDGLYSHPLAATAPEEGSEAERLFIARGTSGSATFSPDGSRLAFVSDRGDHSFIGVFDFADHEISWVSPSVDRDAFPAWSPNGERLAFLRRDGALKGEVFNFLISWPFEVMVAEGDFSTAHNSTARSVWRSPPTGGGFAQIYPRHPLRWASGRLLFFSEHDGWMHIYSMTPDGESLVDLTPGDCETEHSDVDPSGSWLVFSHNCEQTDRRQVSAVRVDGSSRRGLAGADGIHTSPVFSAAGALVYLRSSNAIAPSMVARVDLDGSDFARLETDSPTVSGLVEPQVVMLRAADGRSIHAQLFTPDGDWPRPRPALVFMHGGPMRQMLLGWHYMGYYTRCYAFNQYMASRGWYVISVNFRAGIGYGQEFRLAPDQGPYGASEYQDVVAARNWLAQQEDVDAARIGLWGGSYGGYLTALGLARNSDLFAAGVDLHGVHDWSFRATDFVDGGGWGISGDEAMAEAHESSPVADLSAWTSPVLMVHGDDDRNVLFQQTTDLVVRLRRHGIEPELLVLPDEVHGFLRHASWLDVFAATAEFFERQLGTGRSGAGTD